MYNYDDDDRDAPSRLEWVLLWCFLALAFIGFPLGMVLMAQ